MGSCLKLMKFKMCWSISIQCSTIVDYSLVLSSPRDCPFHSPLCLAAVVCKSAILTVVCTSYRGRRSLTGVAMRQSKTWQWKTSTRCVRARHGPDFVCLHHLTTLGRTFPPFPLPSLHPLNFFSPLPIYPLLPVPLLAFHHLSVFHHSFLLPHLPLSFPFLSSSFLFSPPSLLLPISSLLHIPTLYPTTLPSLLRSSTLPMPSLIRSWGSAANEWRRSTLLRRPMSQLQVNIWRSSILWVWQCVDDCHRDKCIMTNSA